MMTFFDHDILRKISLVRTIYSFMIHASDLALRRGKGF